jgi:hypothetical protein
VHLLVIYKHQYSGTSVHEPILLRNNLFTNKFSEQKTSRVTNGVSSNEHASRQQRLATSWEYRRSTHPFSNSLEFHCVFWFFNVLLNKKSWDQRRINKQSSGVQERINPFYIVSYGKNSFCLRTFRGTNGPQERIKFANRGSTVQCLW